MRTKDTGGILPVSVLTAAAVLIVAGCVGIIAILSLGGVNQREKESAVVSGEKVLEETEQDADFVESDNIIPQNSSRSEVAATVVSNMPPEEKNKELVPEKKEVSPVSDPSIGQAQKDADIKEIPMATEKSLVVQEGDSPLILQFAFDQKWRNAVVNLVCQNENGTISSTGSGVIIDPSGIILTNAHVASEWLWDKKWSLFNEPNKCKIRVGDPAAYKYTGEVLYIARDRIIADAWSIFDKNDEEYVKHAPKDYALLVITGTLNSAEEFPSSFSYIPLYTGPIPKEGSSLYAVGYPARFISYVILAGKDFRMVASPLVVKETRSLYGTTDKNIIAFQGVIAAQHGSSGGAIINNKGELVAIPTFLDPLPTKTFYDKPVGDSSADNVANAITTKYVDEDFKKDTGLTLKEFIAQGDPISRSVKFMEEHASEYQCIYSNVSRIYHHSQPFDICAKWKTENPN